MGNPVSKFTDGRSTAALTAPRPWQRVTGPQRATAYFKAEAQRRLAFLPDDSARLSEVERAERAIWPENAGLSDAEK